MHVRDFFTSSEQQLRQNFVRIRGNVSEPLDPVGHTETDFLGWLYSPERTKGLSDTQKGLTLLTEEMVRLNSSSDLTSEKFIELFNRARAFFEEVEQENNRAATSGGHIDRPGSVQLEQRRRAGTFVGPVEPGRGRCVRADCTCKRPDQCAKHSDW